ncbi:hypothetical protein [Catellatospora chokoriensis]|uniref:Uncharacterized protein n=1 Tax=Catellatospora chokoriensis TaxID=310353 RepID=A0A8J3NVF6_9ACTN|nr:hypothetical protein [Catellatospora chokoriensis]GIF94015.1 hypothetical protein Cch02nite_74590 [Catellatospora chokoriensis]
MLETPGCRVLSAGRQSEARSTIDAESGQVMGPSVAVELCIRHDVGGAIVDVATARDLTGEGSVLHHMWSSLINYQLSSAGRNGGVPWGSGPPPPAFEHLIDANNPPETLDSCAVAADGVRTEWRRIVCPDMATGELVSACGARIGGSLVAVCGPAGMADVAVRMWPSKEQARMSK